MINLPVRLEAWDADEYDKGWALDKEDVVTWAKQVLQHAGGDPTIMVQSLERLIDHLQDLNEDGARVVMLPCPFCGRNAGIYAKSLHRSAPDVTYIQCCCGATLDGFDNESDAVNAWNKRAA